MIYIINKLQASFSAGGSNSNTNSETKTSCSSVSGIAPECPGHYKCERTFTITEIPPTTKDIEVDLNCGGIEGIYQRIKDI